MSDSGEKRKHKRIKRRFMLRVAAADKGPWPTWSLVTAHDLSAGGVTFTCDQAFKMGDRLVVNIQFIDHVIECEGRVSRIVSGSTGSLTEMAVIFEALSEKDRQSIADYTGKMQ